MKFKDLKEESQLNEIIEHSAGRGKGVLIFKHSTRCAISSMALNRFTRRWKMHDEELPVYYLDVIRYRSLSDKVSELLGVTHETPQALLIKNGSCVYHASHNAISPDRFTEEAENV